MLLLLTPLLFFSNAEEPFDVRQHLSTVTRYGASKVVTDNSFVPSTIPDGCSVIHLNLLARHGTRAPTKRRIKELDRLETRLKALLNDAKGDAEEGNAFLQKIPAWLQGWQSPWKGKQTGGQLISKGEEELYHLGIRIRERFPDLFNVNYHPHNFTIKATQVPRASASAVAFGVGLFSEKGILGPGRNRAFAVSTENRASDICMRFYDICKTYKEYKRSQEPAIDKLKKPILDEITSLLIKRYELNFTRHDIASLWFLCKQEASLLDITDQSCGLFSTYEVTLLEWTDDVEAFLLKGYGKSINYRIGVPLLQDVFQSMEQAIVAEEGNEGHNATGPLEKARLRFAHAETLAPFTCLLGLFLEGSEFKQIQAEQRLQLPPKPPQERNWKSSIVSPFAGNNMLVLYKCSNNDSKRVVSSEANKSKYFVQILHNEIPVPAPGCYNTDFCPFEVFKERIVNPHLKHDYESLCNVKEESPKPDSEPPKLKLFPFRFTQKKKKKNDNLY